MTRRLDWAEYRALVERRAAGDFDTFIGWSVETYGGHPDLAYFLDSWHSQFVAKPGSPQPPRSVEGRPPAPVLVLEAAGVAATARRRAGAGRGGQAGSGEGREAGEPGSHHGLAAGVR